ncbi:hypothetical protein KIPB_015013, partial [Kipferlia bialata]
AEKALVASGKELPWVARRIGFGAPIDGDEDHFTYAPHKCIQARAKVIPPSQAACVTHTFQGLCEMGRQPLPSGKTWSDMIDLSNIHHTETMTIVYTSGSTGTPKGAIHDHFALAWVSAYYNQRCIQPPLPHGQPDLLLSYLPNAHIFQRCLNMTMMTCYAGMGIFQGSTATLFDDMAVLRPTIFV